MKKFSLLAIGETFEYQGERYTKSGPLIASRLENGSQRMIPRSAVVTRAPALSRSRIVNAVGVTCFRLHRGSTEHDGPMIRTAP